MANCHSALRLPNEALFLTTLGRIQIVSSIVAIDGPVVFRFPGGQRINVAFPRAGARRSDTVSCAKFVAGELGGAGAFQSDRLKE